LVVKLNDDFQHDDHPFQMGAPLPPKTLSGRCQD
jgi:hypothetical protein